MPRIAAVAALAIMIGFVATAQAQYLIVGNDEKPCSATASRSSARRARHGADRRYRERRPAAPYRQSAA